MSFWINTEEKQMNRIGSVTKPLMWIMASLLVAFVAGCGDDNDAAGGGGPGLAGASPALETAGTYGIFASSAAVTLAVNSSVTGDVGLNPVDACNNCVVGTTVLNGVIHNGDAAAIQAQTDFKAAYDDAATRTLNACPISGDLSAAQAACVGYTPSTPGPTYGPGLYRTTAAMTLDGTITLDAGGNANAVFIFQTDSSLTTGTSSRVLLAGKAKAKNVWWMAGSAATLGVSSHFKGTVIANGAAVGVLSGTSLDPTLVEGRLFSHAAAANVAEYATVTVPQ
jgi:Ice-binding-like